MRNSKISFFVIFILFFCFPQRAFSFPAIQTQPGAGSLPTLVTHENGVWSSRPAAADQTISDLLAVNGIYKLEDYALWLKRNILYKKGEPQDQWPFPGEVFSQRFGDCKGYSVLNSAVLKLLGYQPVILAIQTGDSSHAVCSFQMNGRFAFFDNSTLILTPAHNLDEFETFLFRSYHFTKIAKISGI